MGLRAHATLVSNGKARHAHWAKAALNQLHHTAVFGRRVEILARHLAEVLPQGDAHLLDLGAGDGSIALRLMALRPEFRIEGVDVMLRPKTHIPVTRYDGSVLPFPDRSFDYVSIVDVLHHTDDPAAVLGEARRVSRKGVVVKDHLAQGMLARPTLRLMDWVGNRGHDVVLPYNYLDRGQWQRAFAQAGLLEQKRIDRLALYPQPFSMAFDRTLHFVSLLTPAR